jgi:hypothetical protein
MRQKETRTTASKSFPVPSVENGLDKYGRYRDSVSYVFECFHAAVLEG